MKTILVVDDALPIRVLIRAELENKGYKVETAEDGVQCLEKLDNGLSPDVIVLDLMMPAMSGDQVMEALKKRQKAPPVILMSGFFLKEEFQGIQATAMLAKPFPMKDLVKAIEQALHESTELENN